jgi:protein-S-isoprenylcysteine O-methyltransferase Ste14
VRPLVYQPGVVRVVFYATLAVWVVREFSLQVRTPGGGRDPSYYAMLAGPAAGIGLAFALASVHDRLPGPRWAPAAVGLALMWVGFVLRAWAIRALGRFFTVTVGVEEGHAVVDSGPYRHIRHPSYTGMLLFFVGLGLALDSWLSLAAATVFPLAGLVIRIVYEERLLLRELGEPYATYTKRTSRLLPKIW